MSEPPPYLTVSEIAEAVGWSGKVPRRRLTRWLTRTGLIESIPGHRRVSASKLRTTLPELWGAVCVKGGASCEDR